MTLGTTTLGTTTLATTVPGSIAARSDRALPPDQSLADAARTFAEIRPRLLAIAVRILGRRAEADDIVQDVWVRWQRCDRDAVVNPTAFLVTVTTRLALNLCQSARSRHETYVSEHLPEPTAPEVDPGRRAEMDEELDVGIDLLRATLCPAERAAFVLRVAFDFPYSEIAQKLQLTESNARQVFSRARRHMAYARDGR